MRTTLLSLTVGSLALLALAAPFGAQQPASHPASSPAPAARAEVASYRERLLDVAFTAAAKLPSNPHVKTRAKLMHDVVTAQIAVGARERAAELAESIENWRRGACYAELAVDCARRGDAERARALVERSRAFAERADVGITQDWQKDRILSNAAAALAWLGELERAEELAAGLTESESGSVGLVRARRSEASEFDARLAEIDAALASHHWELSRNALAACAALHERHYAEPELRERAEKAIVAGFETAKLPLQLRVELLLELAASAGAHADAPTAQRLLDLASLAVEQGRFGWTDALPQRARIASARRASGDAARAGNELDALYTSYLAQRERIDNWERCDVLLPIAEAYGALGERAKALGVYRKALEDGRENPNGRSRVEDLVPALCSLAVQGIEPDAALWELVAKIDVGLCAPW
ncbi:MAG: hypothetical protein EPO68_06010 [Planctomycetota bacterium]|nr:MAG: hypothetical protein EPO68_06010 [Planctomycetota bacterium]